MMFPLYPIIGSLIALIAIILALLRFREGKMTIGMLILWILIWIAVIFISVFPETTNTFSSIVGIGRGLDVVLILGLFGCYYLIFKLYTMIENMEKEITQLVRELALQNKEIQQNKSNSTKSTENK